jgi:hypothetical protein
MTRHAFVVQFDTGSVIGGGPVCGRAEHVASGRAVRFRSLEELLAFFGHELASCPLPETEPFLRRNEQ